MEFKQKDSNKYTEIIWGKSGGKPELKSEQQQAWLKVFSSQTQEFSYLIDEIEGSLPETLYNSTLFRNTPGIFERGDQRVKHYLDGDGYLYKFSFASDGQVYFDSKFVKTTEFIQETKANKFLYRSTFGTQKPGGFLSNLGDLSLKNPSNSNIIYWGDKLLSLYEAGLPYQINPITLETIEKGISDHSRSMTAHPHFDPILNRMVTWTWSIGINQLILDLVEYNQKWPKKTQKKYYLKGATIQPHDFALTPSYYIFFENQLSFNALPYLLGIKAPASCLQFNREQATKVHIIPRPDGKMAENFPIVLETSPWFSIHQACAYEEDNGIIHIYSSGWPNSGLEGEFLGSWSGYAPDFDYIAPTYLWQTTIDVQKSQVNHRIIPGAESICIAHPHINPQFETQDFRYIYTVFGNNLGVSSPSIGYLKFDVKTGQKKYWSNHELCFTEEPIFVPKENNLKEDDGYILGMVYDDLDEGRSSLIILDASEFITICRLRLKHHLPHSLHGSWYPIAFC